MKRVLAVLATAAALGAMAQPFPMKPDFERGLGVNADTAAKLESLFAKEREQRQALREKTRAELAKILTPEQLQKFDATGPGRGPRGGGPGGPGGPRGFGGPGQGGYGMHGMYGMGPGMHAGFGPGRGGYGRGECPAWDAKPDAPKAAS